MSNLIAAAAFFVLLHLVVSGTRLRDVLIARIGQGPYMGLFVLASFAGLAWLGWGFAEARAAADNVVYWSVTPATRTIQLVLQVVAMVFIVVGIATRNPTAVRSEAALDDPDIVRGMLRVTRHPFLWGVAIWAVGHLLVNGDRAGLILFGSMLILAVYGTRSIDAKRKRALGASWDAFAARTSNIPFAAILSGRQSLSLGEIGWWKPALGLAVAAAVALAHPYAFGVAALP
ncbi:MAG: NnrU family protein [Phenylobacterium sp.]|uniref:NnrU family protein n=1 Tax=Phenylobacterium sp. TaxID=1871053 RepID=UPI001A64560B|nr:NnrU family protein [Phenylobacterium sp.]MBL8552656.1 NnrU family protein [Phenylobacterium sp.]